MIWIKKRMPFRPDFWSMRFGCLERTLDLLRILHIAFRTVSIEHLCSCAVSLYCILLIKYAISRNRAPFLVCRDMKQTRLYCTWAILLFWIDSTRVCYFGHFLFNLTMLLFWGRYGHSTKSGWSRSVERLYILIR